MTKAKKYDLAFSGCSLKYLEMVTLIEVAKGIKEPSIGGKSAYIKRKNSELRKRINKLSLSQIDALLVGDSILQRQLAYVSVCKAYDFIYEFIIEVLREKMIFTDHQLTEGEYLSFFRRKMIDHPELERLSNLTEKKVKQLVFRILAEAGIIDSTKTKVLQYQILEPQLIRLIREDSPKWFEVFLLNDFEIGTYSNSL
jgi:hypothetical protein